MANITKGLEKYETSIVYYNKVLSKISLNPNLVQKYYIEEAVAMND